MRIVKVMTLTADAVPVEVCRLGVVLGVVVALFGERPDWLLEMPMHVDGGDALATSDGDPDRWLAALPVNLRGSMAWAVEVRA